MAGSRGSLYAKRASQASYAAGIFFYKADGPDSGHWTANQHPARPVINTCLTFLAILFLRNDSLHFEEVGELAAVR